MKKERDYRPDPAPAHIYTWALNAPSGGQVRPMKTKEKHPKEGEIVYAYEGQDAGNPGVAGTSPQPTFMTRMVRGPDGVLVAQITQYHYDAMGHLAYTIDPKGRRTDYNYDGDHLTAIVQSVTTPVLHGDTLAQYLDFDPATNLPRQVVDAAGKATDYVYDATGRVQTATRHRVVGTQTVNEITTCTYSGPGGRLSRITGPSPGRPRTSATMELGM